MRCSLTWLRFRALLIGPLRTPSLFGRQVPKKEVAREKGGSRAMEEIRKQRLVRGIACALWGALDRRGLVVRRCELPRMCYRLSTLHLFRRMSASRKQLAKRSRLKLYFGQDQGAASLPTTWIVRRVR